MGLAQHQLLPGTTAMIINAGNIDMQNTLLSQAVGMVVVVGRMEYMGSLGPVYTIDPMLRLYNDRDTPQEFGQGLIPPGYWAEMSAISHVMLRPIISQMELRIDDMKNGIDPDPYRSGSGRS